MLGEVLVRVNFVECGRIHSGKVGVSILAVKTLLVTVNPCAGQCPTRKDTVLRTSSSN